MAISQELKTYCASFVRKLILRGRAAVGYFSMEGYQSAPDEPTQAITAKRAQHYGLTTEAPAGAEVVVLAIGGGASNRVAIAEYLTDEPEIENGEVLLWSRTGQRVLLDKNGRISLDNGDGGTVVVDGDTTTVSQNLVVARDLTTDHLLGGGDVSHAVTPSTPKITSASASGDDLSFTLSFMVANSQTLSAGDLIATVTLARAYASAPRCVVSPQSDTWPVAGVSFSARATSGSTVGIYYQGANAIPGPSPSLAVSVFVLGHT